MYRIRRIEVRHVTARCSDEEASESFFSRSINLNAGNRVLLKILPLVEQNKN